jgi:hypothetical protein
MTQVISTPADLTPAFVTELLYTSGALQRGEILDVQIKEHETGMSRIAHLDLTASNDAMPMAPHKLFVKLSKTTLPYPDYAELAEREVLFYRDIANARIPTLVRCYSSAYRPEDHQSHLVLEYVDTIDVQPFPDHWPYPPPHAMLERLLASLAACHAACWNPPQREQVEALHPSDAWSPLASRRGAEAFEQFAAELGDRLSPDSLAIYQRVLRAYPLLARRLATRENLTLIHGDFHLNNVLVPPEWQRDPIRIIDWDVWAVHLGTYDVAELLSMPWDTGQGKRERELVRHYYQQLIANGVKGYSWDACWHDYQLVVITHLFSPLQQWADKHWPGFWWNRVGRMLQRFHDLECMEILPG